MLDNICLVTDLTNGWIFVKQQLLWVSASIVVATSNILFYRNKLLVAQHIHQPINQSTSHLLTQGEVSISEPVSLAFYNIYYQSSGIW